jgi:hypothetical protein
MRMSAVRFRAVAPVKSTGYATHHPPEGRLYCQIVTVAPKTVSTNLLEAAHFSPNGDLRKMTGTQGSVATTPLNLIHVADRARMNRTSAENQPLYSAADTGFICQNVYLFCASQGLPTS